VSVTVADVLTGDAFASQVNSRFHLIAGPESAMEVELIEFKAGSKSAHHEAFSIVFRAPAEAPLEQRIYRLEHESMGGFELFLVPIGKSPEGVSYEAVFNRAIDENPGGE
jgi:hypothetical protein